MLRSYAASLRTMGPARYASSSTSPPPRSRRVPLRRLAVPLLLVSAVSSLAINVRNARDTLDQLDSSHQAQKSVLLDLIAKLEMGTRISADEMKREFERVGIIQRQLQKHERSIGWKETIFGRKKTADELQTEQEEITQIEESIRRADEGSRTAAPMPVNIESRSTVLPPLSPTAKLNTAAAEPSASSRKNKGIFI